ncbi:transcriptional regulator [Bacillus cereus]|uniref:helix-turn-helix domain-containing protein n=1 Tax=Bacillus sp. AFS023182 TaxID=2033492 RepID=UPI000BFA1F43|nr:helix-turn-helix transcriptional regulator [Bacillus sp. AFS023182]PFE05079.1 transcriptional regulator [Bacillus sp. AFS023182]PGY03004.1 transcriptional regulator [Bacillus cereus]
MESLGSRLKKYRLKNKLTIDDFIKKYNKNFNASISKSMVSRWENDLAEPKIQVGRNIAIMYSIPFDELVGIIEPGQIVQDGKIIGIPHTENENKNLKTIAAHLEGKDITDDKMKDVLNYIDFIFRDQFDK